MVMILYHRSSTIDYRLKTSIVGCMPAPNLKELAARLLKRDMDAWIVEMRADERTDDWIARKIAEETEGVITPNSDTIGLWRRQMLRKSAEADAS